MDQPGVIFSKLITVPGVTFPLERISIADLPKAKDINDLLGKRNAFSNKHAHSHAHSKRFKSTEYRNGRNFMTVSKVFVRRISEETNYGIGTFVCYIRVLDNSTTFYLGEISIILKG